MLEHTATVQLCSHMHAAAKAVSKSVRASMVVHRSSHAGLHARGVVTVVITAKQKKKRECRTDE